MNPLPDPTNRTIFHFDCSLCGHRPEEQRVEDFVVTWNDLAGEHLSGLLDHVFTAMRQIFRGPSRWLTPKLENSIRVLLKHICNGRDESRFPETIHSTENKWLFPFPTTCPFCLKGPGDRNRTLGAEFNQWNDASSIQIANLCFEVALVLNAVIKRGHYSLTPYGIDLIQICQDLMSVAESTGLQPCPRCGRRTTCLYGPEKPYEVKGRCRWCLDADGPAISVSVDLGEIIEQYLKKKMQP